MTGMKNPKLREMSFQLLSPKKQFQTCYAYPATRAPSAVKFSTVPHYLESTRKLTNQLVTPLLKTRTTKLIQKKQLTTRMKI